MNPTEQTHQSLRNLLLKGRILINGFPLTGTEMGTIIQGEQMLFEKAVQLDKAQAIAQAKKAEKKPVEKGDRGISETSPFHSSNLKKKE